MTQEKNLEIWILQIEFVSMIISGILLVHHTTIYNPIPGTLPKKPHQRKCFLSSARWPCNLKNKNISRYLPTEVYLFV